MAAAAAARTALRATPDQLPELGRAGVVDAGGIGLYVVLDALVALVTGRPRRRPGRRADPRALPGPPAALTARAADVHAGSDGSPATR